MISPDVFNRLKWKVVKAAQDTGVIHYLIHIPSRGSYLLVSSENTILGEDAVIDFIGFKFSDTRKLVEEGYLT